MFYKYLKLIVISTVLLHATPKAFDSLGNELEEFQQDCQTFQKITGIPAEINEACNTYQLQLDKAFDLGYKLDPSVELEKVDEKAAKRYLSKLRLLDKEKEKILGLLYIEARKARKESNLNYYGALIENYKVVLHDSDYAFMGKHKKVFGAHPRYTSNIEYILDLEEQRLKKERAKQAQYIKRKKKKRLQGGLTISSMDQVSPKAFHSLGNELEEFQQDCQTFQKITGISAQINKACNKYQLQLDKAFDLGYKLDPSVELEKVDEKAAKRYLSKLRLLDKEKEKILGLLYIEARKARKESNLNYYGALIENYKVVLHDSDYAFMGKHKKVFGAHPRYTSNIEYILDLEEQRLKKERAKQAQYIKRKKKKRLQGGLTISSMDQVSPKAFHSLGNELEEFQQDCQTFQKITGISAQINKACNKYQLQLDKAFDLGYKLDPSVEQENVNEKAAKRYLSKLLILDKRKEKILRLLYAEARKARDQNNFSYYEELTKNYKVQLYNSDYQYMEKYKKIFSDNARYIAHNKHLQYLEEERIRKERVERLHNPKSVKGKAYRVNY